MTARIMRILIAHSDDAVRGVLAHSLGALQLEVDLLEDPSSILEDARRDSADLVVLGAGERGEGIDACATLKRTWTHFVPVLLLLPGDAPQARLQALSAGADACVETPVDVDDLVARVRSFLRIKSLQDRLAEVDVLRRELLEAVSHDLCSPLVGIIGAVQNMLGGYAGPTTPQQREYLMMIGKTASRFHELIERVQRLARFEGNRAEIRAEDLDLEGETRRAAAPLEPRLDAKGVTIAVETVNGTPFARGEGRLVREALGHLLDNAAKFSPTGGTVRVRIDEVVENESFYVRWAVRDEGPGIRRSDFERIFLRFEQVPGARGSEEPPGTGLGLAVAREIVEVHGGRIEIASELGRGATFTVLLPAAGERAEG